MWHTVLLMRADHLPQQVSRPPCGTLCCSCVLMLLMCADHLPQQVSRPPCGTLCCMLLMQQVCCGTTTFRNRCLGHHVAHCAARAC